VVKGKGLGRATASVVLFALLLALLLGPTAAFAATASLSSSSMAFPDQKVGTTSSAKTSTLENTGVDDLHSIAVSDNTSQFSTSSNCPSTLGPGGTCTITVTFKPTSRGDKAGTVTVSSDASNGAQTIALSGTGTSPGATVSPTSLTFSGRQVGTTSSAKSVTLTNSGNVALSISSTSASGDFDRTSQCGSSLAAGASCTISVKFSPTAAGTRTGTLKINDNAGTGTQTVNLSGTGLAPSVKLSPSALAFEKQRKGTTSPAQAIKLSNVGKATLHITSVSASGDFSQTSNCAGSVGVGDSCTLSVIFHPTAEGIRSGTLTIKDDAGSHQADLSGLGVFPAFSINKERLKFSKTGLGAPSAPKNIKITNPGTDRLYIQKLTLTGDFSQTNTCEPYVNPGITCTISVTFDPKRLRVRTGVLRIVHDLGSATVKLSGVGVAGIGPTTGPSRPEPTLRPSAPAPGGEVQNGSHLMWFIFGGGLFVLVAGFLLMFLSRGGGEESKPALTVADIGPEAAGAPADDDPLLLGSENGEAGGLDDVQAADVPLLSSLEGVNDTLPISRWKEPADEEGRPEPADGQGNGISVGPMGVASELERVIPHSREPDPE
jgi:Abnormal spindle-like microcephaly-assoc'd, ASPM-SPD-2-Hydin